MGLFSIPPCLSLSPHSSYDSNLSSTSSALCMRFVFSPAFSFSLLHTHLLSLPFSLLFITLFHSLSHCEEWTICNHGGTVSFVKPVDVTALESSLSLSVLPLSSSVLSSVCLTPLAHVLSHLFSPSIFISLLPPTLALLLPPRSHELYLQHSSGVYVC